MGFLSYNLDYFTNEISHIENAEANEHTIYHAKQLLKILDDLLDEGYTGLTTSLETSCHGISRLRNYIELNHAEPFPEPHRIPKDKEVEYNPNVIELTDAIQELTNKANKNQDVRYDAFLNELACFCKWIGYENDTSYIFLFRDTLLPYVYYQSKVRTNIYPWLLGRKTLEQMTCEADVDDEIRASIYNALESGESKCFEGFCKAALPKIRATLRKYPIVEETFTGMLKEIDSKRIIVVESGCSGTFPMMLKSLDDRVDIRMYTTYPYLLEAYGGRIYSPKYEENRLFETLYSQDLYLQFAEMRGNRFYVRTCTSKEIRRRSFAEVKAISKLSNQDTP